MVNTYGFLSDSIVSVFNPIEFNLCSMIPEMVKTKNINATINIVWFIDACFECAVVEEVLIVSGLNSFPISKIGSLDHRIHEIFVCTMYSEFVLVRIFVEYHINFLMSSIFDRNFNRVDFLMDFLIDSIEYTYHFKWKQKFNDAIYIIIIPFELIMNEWMN
jgi:hypothetical protein